MTANKHNLLLHRAFQYLGIILVMAAMGGGYWYWKQAQAGLNINTSQEGTLSNGLVGYWPFDGNDISGTTAYDRSGQGNNGTLTNGPTKAMGKVGQALSFDGTDDYVELGAFTGVSGATQVSVNFWVKINTLDSTDSNIIHTGDNGEIMFGVNSSNRLHFSVKLSDSNWYDVVASSLSLSAGQWYHVVGNWRKNFSIELYVNGVSQGTAATGNFDLYDPGANYTFTIGASDISSGKSYYFPGPIDEVRIYNRALSAGEIWGLYQMGKPDEVNTGASQIDPLEKGMVGYWKLDDASGTSAADASGNGNTGTLTNGPTWTTGQIGGATNFDGTDDYIATNDVNALDGLSSLTVSAWANADALTQDKTIFSKSNSSADGDRVQLALGGTGYGGPNDVTLSIGDASNQYAYTTGDIVSTGVWSHYVMVFDGTQTGNANRLKLYKNGIQQALTFGGGVTIPATTSASNAGIFQIGAETNHVTSNRYWDGFIDEIRVYNRPLGADEIVKLYKTTVPDDPDTGLVGYWSFNGSDLSGTTAYDRSGKGNTGTLTNGPTKTIGKIGQALSFNGTNQYVNGGTGSELLGAWTLSAWVKSSTLSSGVVQTIVSRGRNNTNNSRDYLMYFFNSKFSIQRSDGATYPTVNTSGTYSNNTWYHVVGVFDGANGTIYVNGVADGTGSLAVSIPSATRSVNVGVTQESTGLLYYANAAIDEPRIYNRALSAGEIWDLYQLGNPDKVNSADSQIDSLEKGMVGYWKLDDASGTSAVDSSGNGNTGTLTNGPTWTTGQIGGATNFDGTNDEITTTNSISASNFTLSTWFKTSSSSGKKIIGFEDQQTGTGSGIYVDTIFVGTDGKLKFAWFAGGVQIISSASSCADNAWHHAVATHIASGAVALYVDGALQGTGTGGVTFNNGYWRIGGYACIGVTDCSNGYFPGSIDEVRVYNRALSAEEVTKLYKTTAPDDPDTGLVGYWPFNGSDISGTTAYDRSRIGKNATLVNGASATIGKVGQGINLDGSNDYLSVVDDVSQHFGTGDFTYSFWTYLNDTSQGVFFSNGTYVDGIMFYRYDSGTTYLWIGNANGQSSAWNPPARTWQHVVLRRASGTVYMYANGVQQFTLGLGGNVTDVSASGMRIGYGFAGGANVVLNGKIDEFRMYNRALSTAEIAGLYNAGR